MRRGLIDEGKATLRCQLLKLDHLSPFTVQTLTWLRDSGKKGTSWNAYMSLTLACLLVAKPWDIEGGNSLLVLVATAQG